MPARRPPQNSMALRDLGFICAAAAVGCGGMGIIRALWKRTSARSAEAVAATWAVVASLMLGRLLTAAFVRGLVPALNAETALPAVGLVACALFGLLGLGRLWPSKKRVLGYPWRGAGWQVAVGCFVGMILGTALTHFWASLRTLPFMLTTIAASNIVPISFLEEVVWRGRMIDVLCTRWEHSDRVVAVQAVLFAVVHLLDAPFLIYAEKAGILPAGQHGCMLVMRRVAIAFMLGWICGTLRQRQCSLWGASACHVVYNLMVYAGTTL